MRTAGRSFVLLSGVAALVCGCASGPSPAEQARRAEARKVELARQQVEADRKREEAERREAEQRARNARAAALEQEARATEEAGRPRQAFGQYLAALASIGADPSPETASRLREGVIRLARALTPAPAIPETAVRHMLHGQVAVKQANRPADYRIAVEEFQKATEAAPWWAEAYFNLAVVQEKAGLEQDAARSFKWYLRVAPDAKDARDVQMKIAGLEYGEQLKRRRMQDWVGTWIASTKLNSRSECRRSGPMEYRSNAFDFKIDVLSVSDSGEAMVELVVPEIGWRPGTQWPAEASASSLSVTGKGGEKVELSRDGNQTIARVAYIHDFRHNYPLGPPLICKYNYELNSPVTRR